MPTTPPIPTLYALQFNGAEEGRSGLYGAFGSIEAAEGFAGILAARTPLKKVNWEVLPIRQPELPEEPMPTT